MKSPTLPLSHKIKWSWGYDGYGARIRVPRAEIRMTYGGAQLLIKVPQFNDKFAWSMNAGMRLNSFELIEIHDYIRNVQNELERL